jgi:hypothetical protein
MTLLTPFLFALIFIIPALVMSNEDKDFKKIAVVEDGTDLFTNVIPDTRDTDFEYLSGVKLNDIKNNFTEMGYYGVLYISPDLVTNPDAIQLVSRKQPPIGLLDHDLRLAREGDLKAKCFAYNNDNREEILRPINTMSGIMTKKKDETGQCPETSTGISMCACLPGQVPI